MKRFMPVSRRPEYFDSAVLVINGKSYAVTDIEITYPDPQKGIFTEWGFRQNQQTPEFRGKLAEGSV